MYIYPAPRSKLSRSPSLSLSCVHPSYKMSGNTDYTTQRLSSTQREEITSEVAIRSGQMTSIPLQSWVRADRSVHEGERVARPDHGLIHG